MPRGQKTATIVRRTKATWDYPDADGHLGATACIVVPALLPWYDQTGDWTPLAWWVHDNLPYANQYWFPKLAAFNLRWSANPQMLPSINTYITNGVYPVERAP